jgi:hypothetical protein
MPANIILTIRLGPLVSFRIQGNSCLELLEALQGFDRLNERVDEMCSDLGERMYPEGPRDVDWSEEVEE